MRTTFNHRKFEPLPAEIWAARRADAIVARSAALTRVVTAADAVPGIRAVFVVLLASVLLGRPTGAGQVHALLASLPAAMRVLIGAPSGAPSPRAVVRALADIEDRFDADAVSGWFTELADTNGDGRGPAGGPAGNAPVRSVDARRVPTFAQAHPVPDGPADRRVPALSGSETGGAR